MLINYTSPDLLSPPISHINSKSSYLFFFLHYMDPYMDEKWKLSKNKSSRNSSVRRESSSTAAAAATTSSSGDGSSAYLKRSSSMPAARAANTGPSSFTSRCTNVVKEQRSRFYIMKRCVTMLICWRDYP
ncbi:uncharacterized protein LOC110022942 [Phalaenopsis equestris]|uniref:uncharacterized protein LOC110022942 n=1 Tax=Phalaenopsis equestris TaxID=78828 RepID=UPI0009E43856|nr:uncharacterized protein LOC110022942 [Phalaenopsis equestris]